MIKKPLSDPPHCSNDLLAIQDALDTLGGKWRLLLLHYLAIRPDQTNTFNKILKDINGISPKVLTSELRNLEMNKLIVRTPLPTKPASVAYSISQYGLTTMPLIQCLVQWGTLHRTKIYTESTNNDKLEGK